MTDLVVRPLLAAFAFLTRLPVPGRGGNKSASNSRAGHSIAESTLAESTLERDLGRSVGFFPVVGLVLGLLVAGLAYVSARLFPPTMTAVLLVAGLALVTGGLHLDGLADLFDGLGGGRGDRARTLAIMRDSRIGAHGAVALGLLLAAKIAAFAVLVEARDYAALIAVPVIGRFAVAPSIVLFPYARAEGLGRAFNGEAGPWQLAIAAAIMAAIAIALGPALFKATLAAALVALLLGVALRARLGGLTGDSYGATIEIAEVTAAFVATLG